MAMDSKSAVPSVDSVCSAHDCSEEFTQAYSKAVAGDADPQNRVGEMLLFGKDVAVDYHAGT
jgi:hypothetical protein